MLDPSTAPLPPGPRAEGVGEPLAVLRLETLRARAAGLGSSDGPAWTALREDAAAVTAELAATGWLPPALVVTDDDPAVVVARTLAAAVRAIAAGRR